MKKIARVVSLILALCLLVPFFASCDKKPGLYAWYGGRMNVKNVLTITVDAGGEAKAYEVPFDTYRAVFVYLKGVITGQAMGNDDGAKLVYVDENNTLFVSIDEQTAAIKEVTEDTLVEYYSLLALCEKYGISITEDDKTAFHDDHMKKIYDYIEQIEASGETYKGTKENYAEELYRKSLSLAGGMTPEYLEFSYYRNLLSKRLKLFVSADLDDYLAQNYCHFKQVLIPFTKGDSVAEKDAKRKIDEAYGKLLAGADIDDTVAEYGVEGAVYEMYFDGFGNIVGSSAGEAVNDITSNAVRALKENEVSEILAGDVDDRTGYFAIFQLLPINKEYVCGEDPVGRAMFESVYVGASTYSPLYDRYTLTVESYRQNTACAPISDKVYRRIAVNTLF